MIPEFVNRLSGVIVFPEPTIGQLREITTRSILPSFNRVLNTFGSTVELDTNAANILAECALETRTYARGIKIIVSKLVEDVVFDAHEGTIRVSAANALQAIKAAGLIGDIRTTTSHEHAVLATTG